jgi:curved DNA-binding protein CbpA
MLLRKHLDFDPYSLLQVRPDASEDDIRSAYQRLARRYHPDLNPGIGSSQMERLNQAYAILGDASRRGSYDAEHLHPPTLERTDSRRPRAPSDIAGAAASGGGTRDTQSSAPRDRECRRCHRILPANAARCKLCGAA